LKVAVEGHFITRGNNHAYGTSNIVGWIVGCPHTSTANRIHFAIFSLECEIHQSGLHMVQCGTSQWFGTLQLSGRIFRAGHRCIPCKGMDYLIGGICSRTIASCFLQVVPILKPWNSQCLRTTSWSLLPLAACRVGNVDGKILRVRDRHTRQMIGNIIFCSFLIFDFYVKFLE
jgi:hypothetical protein